MGAFVFENFKPRREVEGGRGGFELAGWRTDKSSALVTAVLESAAPGGLIDRHRR